jgi:hypothetical protein
MGLRGALLNYRIPRGNPSCSHGKHDPFPHGLIQQFFIFLTMRRRCLSLTRAHGAVRVELSESDDGGGGRERAVRGSSGGTAASPVGGLMGAVATAVQGRG